jgi:hypothetical protein
VHPETAAPIAAVLKTMKNGRNMFSALRLVQSAQFMSGGAAVHRAGRPSDERARVELHSSRASLLRRIRAASSIRVAHLCFAEYEPLALLRDLAGYLENGPLDRSVNLELQRGGADRAPSGHRHGHIEHCRDDSALDVSTWNRELGPNGEAKLRAAFAVTHDLG